MKRHLILIVATLVLASGVLTGCAQETTPESISPQQTEPSQVGLTPGIIAVFPDLSETTPDMIRIKLQYMDKDWNPVNIQDMAAGVNVKIMGTSIQDINKSVIVYYGSAIVHSSDDIITLPTSYLDLSGVNPALAYEIIVCRLNAPDLRCSGPLEIPRK